jgi:hypothetical protein
LVDHRAMPSSLETLVGSMTIAELAERSGKSVETIAAFALGGRSPSRSSSAPSDSGARAPRKGARKGSKAATPADDGGSFDEQVLAAITAAGGEARSVDIEDKVGGTSEERRAALHRLVKARKLKRSGVARGTRYSVR